MFLGITVSLRQSPKHMWHAPEVPRGETKSIQFSGLGHLVHHGVSILLVCDGLPPRRRRGVRGPLAKGMMVPRLRAARGVPVRLAARGRERRQEPAPTGEGRCTSSSHRRLSISRKTTVTSSRATTDSSRCKYKVSFLIWCCGWLLFSVHCWFVCVRAS